MIKFKAELRFAVEDIVRFTTEEGERVGVIENIDGENYTVRVYATSGDDIVATDTSVTLTDAELSDYFETVEDTIEETDAEKFLKAIEIEIEQEEEDAISELLGEESKAVDLQPTEEMAKEAQQGLDWREEFNRGGTEVGVARARDISNRTNLSENTIFRMVSFFARHEVDKQATGFNSGEEGFPSAGRIAWALWGGDAGKAWAESKALEIEGENAPEEKAQTMGLGDFVEYESEGGKVCGKVNDIYTEMEVYEGMTASKEEPVVEVEVYEQGEDGLVPSGLMTYRRMSEVMMCDVPKMGTVKHLPRFVGKLKKSEVIKEEGSSIGIIKGYLSIFGNTDLGGDVVKAGAFKRSLQHNEGKVVFMADHGYKTFEVLGVLELEEDEKGLKMLGKINLKTEQGRNAFETIKFQTEHGVPIGASIGYEPLKYVRNSTNGYDLEEVKLAEGSVTPFPMNEEALITEASKRFNREKREKRRRLFQTLKR